MNIDPSHRDSRHLRRDPLAVMLRRRAVERADEQRRQDHGQAHAGINGQPITPPHLQRAQATTRRNGAGGLFR